MADSSPGWDPQLEALAAEARPRPVAEQARPIKPVVDLRRAPEARPPCWLVWSLQTSGLTQLRAIDTSARNAAKHARACRSESGVIKAWVELRDMNHLYGHADLTEHLITNRAELYKLADELRRDDARG